MKSFTFLSALASVVAVNAQGTSSSSAASATPSANPLIPQGISVSCSSFLTSLNINPSLTSCLKPIVSATSQFGPAGNSQNVSASSISSALNSVCGDSSSCDTSAIRGLLSQFYTSCTAELTGATANKDVIDTYDFLYVLTPFRDAVCTKDESGKYCVNVLKAGPSTPGGSKAAGNSKLALVENNLWSGSPLTRRAADTEGVTAALIPNVTTFRTTNLPFLFLTPDMDSSALCVSCTRLVLSAYITFETSVPYAPGLTNSPLLGGQVDLYNGVNATCGAAFMSGVAQAAGGLSGGLLGSSGAMAVSPNSIVTFGSMLAAVGAGVAYLL